MLIARVHLKPSKPVHRNARDMVRTLIGCWQTNGQVLSGKAEVYNGGFEFVALLPERTSLDKRHANPEVRWVLERLTAMNVAPPRVEILGRSAEWHGVDRCKSPSCYVLVSPRGSAEPPIRCGDCYKPVPLYRLPGWKWHESRRPIGRRRSLPVPCIDYVHLTDWQEEYRRCDWLWINSGVGEMFAKKQLSDVKSELTERGLSAAETLADAVGKKVYYYLYRHDGRSWALERKRRCPKCKRAWFLKSPWLNRFDFRCERCSLVSEMGYCPR